MVIVFYTLVFISIWHFFYESVLAPSLRHGLRYEFFSLRDELRLMKINGLKGKNDNTVYEILDHTMCDIINSMSFITLANYFLLKKDYAENKEYKKDAEHVGNLIKSVSNTELIDIDAQLRKLSSKALIINNGGLIPYLIVLAIILVVPLLIFTHLRRILLVINNISTRLVYGSEKLSKIPQAIKVANSF